MKIYEQQETGWCGPASLQIALAHLGEEYEQDWIAHTTACSVFGETSNDAMLRFVSLNGFSFWCLVLARWEDLLFGDGVVTIVDYTKDGVGHYSVVVDRKQEYLYLADPEVGNIEVWERKLFEEHWHDDGCSRWALIIYKKGSETWDLSLIL